MSGGSSEELSVGTIVGGKYRIESLVGRGGFGAVYRAVDQSLGRFVAVKVLHHDHSSGYQPQTRARVQRELEVLARLRDAHTVTLFDHGVTDGGQYYMVFEYLGGRDLADVLAEAGTLPAPVVVHILRQLLSSVGEAHREGLLHRDLKPENVRVFEYGGDPWYVKLLDFGIARATAPDASVTATGELIGTPRYMSPEQLTEKSLTPASDLYSLGMMAFEMLAGRDALTGHRFADQLERLLPDHQFEVSGFDSDVLARVISRMTARHPEDRFPSAESVLSALDERTPQAAQPVRPVPATTVADASRPARLRWVIGASVALVAVAAALTLASRGDEAPEAAPRTEHRALPSALVRTNEPARPAEDVVEVPDVGMGTADARTAADAAADATSGCGRKPRFHGAGKVSAQLSERVEPWRVYVPNGYDGSRAVPILILLHDDGFTADEQLEHSGFPALADAHGFVVMAPNDDFYQPWDDPDTSAPLVHERLLATSRELCIDERRVFVVSQGAGGALAHRLACEPWVAGVATNSYRGKFFDEIERDCVGRPPYLTIEPTKSGQLPLEGGPNCMDRRRRSYEDSLRYWKKRHACEGSSRSAPGGSSGGTCTTWDCEVPFVSCLVDGGHGWPGTPQRFTDFKGCDGRPPEFPTARVMWEFLSTAVPAAPASAAPAAAQGDEAEGDERE